MKNLALLFATVLLASSVHAEDVGALSPVRLRCEYLADPTGIDQVHPRLTWRVESDQRGQLQTAYQILVASNETELSRDEADRWDSGKVESDQTLHVVYQGKPLASRQTCYWKIKTWDAAGVVSDWSDVGFWSMGLLVDDDWSADYISYRDESAIHTDTSTLYLPAARQYRKEFDAGRKTIARATVYATALGIYELHLNGQRVGDAYFAPGWTDYRQRAYYNTYDVTDLVNSGDNSIGAWVAEGWYSGYVGFGLLTGMGTEKNGRSNYGKTPALMAQLEIQYTDGTTEIVKTDSTWKVTGDGPITEADLLMGEAYDARREMPGWATPGFDDSDWQSAIRAQDNGKTTAMFYEARNPEVKGRGPKITGKPRSLGFQRPQLEAFPGVPVRVTETIASKSVAKREDGTYVFDLGQNFAGIIRMMVQGPAGQRIQIRYGEMLHPDGRLMTENLRKSRATDFYTCKGDPEGEVYESRFTFHGFQFVEVSNFPMENGENPSLDAVTGLVMHSDTPMTSTFDCNDPMVNRLFQNVLWTQRANFLDLPTDCPQRDERMGWTGDAQAYVGTAAYNADIGAFYTKWLRELMESQRPSGAFPGYAPFTFQHGWDFGTAWADAGVICPWTLWQAYGDTRVIEDCWEPMTRFMDWRERTSKDDLGVSHGNAWGDWLAQGASTPLEYVDTIYLAISSDMMAEMAEAIGKEDDAKKYREQFERTKKAFNEKYVTDAGRVNVPTQSAQALALFADLIPDEQREATGQFLAGMIAKNGNRMSTGFLGTRPLLPVLSASGQHNLATFLLQSRDFPSWGYEIANGATTIWERWDSYTREDAFGRHNAAMNSFSHYAFGAVCEWMFGTLAGIRSDGPGYAKIIIDPRPPQSGSNAMNDPIDRVEASYDSIRGKIVSDWRMLADQFHLNVTIPANTTATVYLPTADAGSITEDGKSLELNEHVSLIGTERGKVKLSIGSGSYSFVASNGVGKAVQALETSEPMDMSANPDEIDLAKTEQLIAWDFSNAAAVARWKSRSNLDIEVGTSYSTLSPTGDDSQFAITMDQAVQGNLILAIDAKPVTDETPQFFWASPGGGFNGAHMGGRDVKASKEFQTYLFTIRESEPINQIRIDPFRSYDPYAKQPKMLIRSISIRSMAPDKPAAKKKPRLNESTSMPNVLFFLSEDQGNHLSFLGTPGLKTPHLDRLARSGVYFDNAFVAYPVCSASKAAIYTGMHNHTNGILNNTHNFHKPAHLVTDGERNRQLARTNKVKKRFVTLTELLDANGYCQAVTHKLHVLPNEKFPYDEFHRHDTDQMEAFINKSSELNRPFFMMVNIPYSHRPYPNSDKKPIRVNPDEVSVPEFLPDTKEVRKDWAEYLAGVEKMDSVVGDAMSKLEASGQAGNTIIVYMSDHGPTFQHGKMTLYDLGLRTPMVVSGPLIPTDQRSSALVSGVDMLPTIRDLIERHADTKLKLPKESVPKRQEQNADGYFASLDGKSFAKNVVEPDRQGVRKFVFAEISNAGPLPNDGIQERCVFDGRWKLIYRENVEKAWRQVNADTREMKPWGNRTYGETLRVKDQFPRQYEILAEMDPQNLGGRVRKLEFYDLQRDPDEMNDLVKIAKFAPERERLLEALVSWCNRTKDVSIGKLTQSKSLTPN